MPPSPDGQLTVEATDIYQLSLTATRHPDVAFDEGRAAMRVKVEAAQDNPGVRDAFCKVTLTNTEGHELFEVESVMRVIFSTDVVGEFNVEALEDTISEVALRVAYPYHRSAVAHSVAVAGLPGLVIPLAPDDNWRQVVVDSKTIDEQPY